MVPDNVLRMPWLRLFEIDHTFRSVRLRIPNIRTEEEYSTMCNKAFEIVVTEAMRREIFTTLNKPCSPVNIMGARHSVGIDASACQLFGIITQKAALTVYHPAPGGQIRIWVPRSIGGLGIVEHPDILSTTISVDLRADESPLECILDGLEEIELGEKGLGPLVIDTGVLTYLGAIAANPEIDVEEIVEAQCIYTFDLEIAPDIHPVPKGRVESWSALTVDQVREALARRMFVGDSTVVMIDFLIRHGYITSENEPDYAEIVARMHRKLPFPTSASGSGDGTMPRAVIPRIDADGTVTLQVH